MQHSAWVKLGDIRSLAKAIKTNRQQALALWETENETLQEMWMKQEDPMTESAGWSLTVDRVAKRLEGLKLTVLQESIEMEIANAAPETQWTMNMALAQIGTCFPALREKAIAIGEQLGIYRNYPVSKGCTSPFAPVWINEMV
jgi:3-methyladenine DNA glycosylase AlkD